jgi:membrane protease subunit HflK
MIFQNQSGGGGKNPWGKPPGGDGPRNPWGGGGNKGSGGGDPPPDLDDLLRKAHANLRQVLPGHMGGGRIFGLAACAIALLWLASGLYIIEPGENGVIQRFGKLERTQTGTGLGYHMPWPVETIQTVNVSRLRYLSIGVPDGNNNQGARGAADDSLMLTSDANIVDLNVDIQWNIKSAEAYLFNIDDPENTIRKVAASAIREVIGQTEMMPILTTRQSEISNEIKELMQKILDNYQSGISINQVLFQKAQVHPDVQDDFQKVQSAKQEAYKMTNEADTYEQDIVPKAEGKAQQIAQNAQAYHDATIAQATGEAKKFDAIYESYQNAKDLTRTRLYLETMEDVLKHSQIVVTDGKGNVMPYMPFGSNDTPAPPPQTLPGMQTQDSATAAEVKP